MKKVRRALLIVPVVLLFPMRVHGYIDPGTMSYVLQVVVAGVVGGLFSLKLYWKRIRSYFKVKSAKKSDDGKTQ